jgi:hypothetical protein
MQQEGPPATNAALPDDLAALYQRTNNAANSCIIDSEESDAENSEAENAQLLRTIHALASSSRASFGAVAGGKPSAPFPSSSREGRITEASESSISAGESSSLHESPAGHEGTHGLTTTIHPLQRSDLDAGDYPVEKENEYVHEVRMIAI